MGNLHKDLDGNPDKNISLSVYVNVDITLTDDQVTALEKMDESEFDGSIEQLKEFIADDVGEYLYGGESADVDGVIRNEDSEDDDEITWFSYDWNSSGERANFS